MMDDDQAVLVVEAATKKGKKTLVMREMMGRCVETAAKKLMDKAAEARKKERVACVTKIDDELKENMVPLGATMQTHLNDMERPWTDKFFNKGQPQWMLLFRLRNTGLRRTSECTKSTTISSQNGGSDL